MISEVIILNIENQYFTKVLNQSYQQENKKANL